MGTQGKCLTVFVGQFGLSFVWSALSQTDSSILRQLGHPRFQRREGISSKAKSTTLHWSGLSLPTPNKVNSGNKLPEGNSLYKVVCLCCRSWSQYQSPREGSCSHKGDQPLGERTVLLPESGWCGPLAPRCLYPTEPRSAGRVGCWGHV